MLGQGLLNLCELLNQELQLQPGESNVTRGLTALNAAQDYFESLAAVRPNIFGSSVGTVTTTANTETTAYPPGLLRIDRLQRLNASGVPVQELYRVQRTGGHAASVSWPSSLLGSGTGAPVGYWTNGRFFYWSPPPDAIYTVRWYGFSAAAAIAAAGTFAYEDIVALPLASFAVRLMKGGIDDDVRDVASLAAETFKPVFDALSLANRDGPQGFAYTQVHST